MKYIVIIGICALQYMFAINETDDFIELREKFFKESFAQQYDLAKIQKDSKTKLEFIDFCVYPPDRSLVFGALDNGRFKGEKIKDLPFECNQNSGAKKFFIKNSDIQLAYNIFRLTIPLASFLQEKMPTGNKKIALQNGSILYIWQKSHKGITRLWVIYDGTTEMRTIIFTQNGTTTESILQYLTR